jgi:hypothetical protein
MTMTEFTNLFRSDPVVDDLVKLIKLELEKKEQLKIYE